MRWNILRPSQSMERTFDLNMQVLLKLLFLAFMVFLAKPEDSSGDESPSTNELFSEEAKSTIKELKQYMTNLDSAYDEIGTQFKKQNSVLDALNEYKKAFEGANGTSCQGEEIPIEDDKDLLDSFIEECVDSLPVDKLAAYSKKIKTGKAKVKEIDDALRENEATCKSDPTSCEEKKKKLLDDLKNILSAKEKENYEKDVHVVLDDAKKHLEDCFTEEANDLLDELQSNTNNINECKSKLS